MSRQPPRSLLPVHGAGSGPWIFKEWGSAFPGMPFPPLTYKKTLMSQKQA